MFWSPGLELSIGGVPFSRRISVGGIRLLFVFVWWRVRNQACTRTETMCLAKERYKGLSMCWSSL